ncbi:MAG: hypothetical protein SGI84_14310 [Gemmatimonadota bacterium]|nr:hypothetical protein [Gemmatimonadota bacterium]
MSTKLRVFAATTAALTLLASASPAQDGRVGLKSGWLDAGASISNLRLVSQTPRSAGFFDPTNPGDFFTANTDLAFKGNLAFLGNFAGFQVYDISDPAHPRLRLGFSCPGGQGDLSVYQNLLFMSVEMPNGRTDCGTNAPTTAVSPDRFNGVRIFDISNLDRPRQVAAIQTCRGSHTHTLVPDLRDRSRVFLYVSGVGPVRTAEMQGCTGGPPEQNPNTAMFRIEVIEVPLAAPEAARVVNAPRIFADRQSGAIAGLWAGGNHGPGSQQTATTESCHDITVYPEIGLAAGACSGNGILLDISDPANPVRIDEVMDNNFAYWHSATFSNDGRSLIFTDEWGGGMAPRCRAADDPKWGANALFNLVDRKLAFAGYYKLPAAQSATENCVAHNGSLIPVPGRDIKVQAWYQGGISVFDFTDPVKPVEIASFDRGPVSDTTLHLAGQWSSYWYNGHIIGSEIARGLDVLELVASPHLTQNEIDAARLVQLETFNPQTQPRAIWPPAFVVARAYLDQLARGATVPAARLGAIRTELARVEALAPGAPRRAALEQLAGTATQLAGIGADTDARRLRALARTLREIAVLP